MSIAELGPADRDAAVNLWTQCGLTVPWNDPFKDFSRALEAPSSAVLGLKQKGMLIGSVMVGYDGHRGWMYYLAVAPDHQGQQYGRQLVEAAEVWLQAQVAPKVQLMVRATNSAVIGFYEKLGYKDDEVIVLSKRFAP